MTLRGRIHNGVVVLDDPSGLVEGTVVTVRPVTNKTKKGRQGGTLRRRLAKHAGKVTDLPADAARNLDHYLYGHPKK